MSYRKATDILPIEILQVIQEYVDGDYLYIPKKKENIKEWGTNTRNKEIFEKYMQGYSTIQLATLYYLSHKTIQRIIRQQRSA